MTLKAENSDQLRGATILNKANVKPLSETSVAIHWRKEMKTADRTKKRPEIGHSSERLYEDHRTKQKSRTQAGTAICEGCGAVGMQKHWFVDQKLSEHYAADPAVRFVTCPGCKRITDKIFQGELILESSLLSTNREMVYGTLFHAAAMGFLHNPLSRIAVFEDHGEKIRILTTTCTLAESLGKAIHKSMKGKLEIKPSKDEEFVIVRWIR